MMRELPGTQPHLLRYLQLSAAQPKDDSGLRFLDRRENEFALAYATLWARAECAAGALHELGVREGDRVAIILPTCPEFMDAFFGIQMLGAIPVPLYPPVRLGRMDEYFDKTAAMLASVDACAIITSGMVSRVIGMILRLYSPPLGMVKADKLSKGNPRPAQIGSVDALAMIQFSSGTTVDPKAVALTHRQVLANTLAIAENLLAVGATLDSAGTPVRHSIVSWLPLYHDMGLIGGLFTSIVANSELILISPEIFLSRPALWLRAISRYRAVGTVAPNFAFGLCAERVRDEEIADCDFSHWYVSLCGAEPVSTGIMQSFAERFAPYRFRYESLTPVYGLSEAALALTFSDCLQPMRALQVDRQALLQGQVHVLHKGKADGDCEPGLAGAAEVVSVGAPLRGFAIEIRDRDDCVSILGDDREGLVFARGPSICSGYYNRDDAPIEDGWLNTGDLGFMHEGELYITGRAKDVVIINGENHAPQDIERSLGAVEGVRVGCAAAVGMTDEDGEKLVVFVEYREQRPGLAVDCRKAILKHTQLDPQLVVALAPGTLPRTSSGKIRRTETLRQWLNGELSAPDKITPFLLAGAMASSMGARVSDMVRRRLGKSERGGTPGG